MYNEGKTSKISKMEKYMRNTDWFPNEPWGPKFRTFCEGDVRRSPAWDTWADALEELLNPAPGEEPEYEGKRTSY